MNAATPTGYVQKTRAEPQRLATVIGGMLVVTAAALYVWFIGGRSLSADVDAIRRFVGRALAALSSATTGNSSHSTSTFSAAICGNRKVSR